jgi:hypothetical protein
MSHAAAQAVPDATRSIIVFKHEDSVDDVTSTGTRPRHESQMFRPVGARASFVLTTR